MARNTRGSVARPALVYVHGLWHQGPESWLLHRRLQARFDFHYYGYRSVGGSMAEACAGLHARVAALDAPVVHLLGHSLGGLVIHRYLSQTPPAQPGRVVFLGSPMAGSAAAAGAARHGWIRPLLGRCVAEELLVPRLRQWRDARPLGLIAGTRGCGLGGFFTRFDEPNDGVVAISETRVPGASDAIAVRATHLGLLFSAQVARQVDAFLHTGRFALRQSFSSTLD